MLLFCHLKGIAFFCCMPEKWEAVSQTPKVGDLHIPHSLNKQLLTDAYFFLQIND